MSSPSNILPDYLNAAELDAFLQSALAADIGSGDITSLATVDAHAEVEATFVIRNHAIAAGLYIAERVFALLAPDVTVAWTSRDGAIVEPGDVLGKVQGNARMILAGERLALNLMQRMSGVATATHALVQAVYPVKVRDTRKTAPGMNLLDKWAVTLGEGENHRLGLYDRLLIKDNHVAATGSLTTAIRRACDYRDRHAPGTIIEVEVRTFDEISEALSVGGFDEILLDNMISAKPWSTVDASRLIRAVDLIDGRYITEASGNVTLFSASAIASSGVDYASSGSLTHSVDAMDIALKIAYSSRPAI